MLRLQNMTIQHKLIAFFMAPTTLILVLAFTFFVLWEQIDSRNYLIYDTISHAGMLADNCKSSLAFNDKEDADQILASLRFQKSIAIACVYDKEGKIFSLYESEDLAEPIQVPKPEPEGYDYKNGSFYVFKHIILDGEVIGTVYLQDNMKRSKAEFKWDIVIAIVILFAALLIGYLLSSKLQAMVLKPILYLAEIAKEVSEKKDYSVRALQKSNDEIGYLTSVFNKMLEQIQLRESALTEARDQLEQRVKERTAELTTANSRLKSEVTERIKAEEQIRQQNDFLSTILESLTHPFYVIDPDNCTVKIANSAAKQELGINLSGKITCHKLTHRRDEPCHKNKERCPIEEIKRTGKPVVLEHIHYDKDNNSKYVEVHAYPIFNEEARLSEVIEYSLDITERKKAEAELKAAQEKVIESARKAGMAEVAADVLHNVGNVLNSINVSTTLIIEKIANSELINLEKLAGLINEHIEDLGAFLTEHPQGKYVPVYLTEVGKCLIDEQSEIISRLRELANNVEHIKEIISTQQSYAKVTGVEVQVSIAKLVEDAIQINSAGLQRHGTQLVREFDELPDIEIDKQKVLQILVNLISNAKYAVSNNGKDEKTVIIRVYKHCEVCFRIEVADNGVGISEENLTKIFSHGFTTKKHGHGFGLHSSALAAKELGGGLTVHSDGMGQGATFTLEIPFKPVEIT